MPARRPRPSFCNPCPGARILPSSPSSDPVPILAVLSVICPSDIHCASGAFRSLAKSCPLSICSPRFNSTHISGLSFAFIYFIASDPLFSLFPGKINFDIVPFQRNVQDELSNIYICLHTRNILRTRSSERKCVPCLTRGRGAAPLGVESWPWRHQILGQLPDLSMLPFVICKVGMIIAPPFRDRSQAIKKSLM